MGILPGNWKILKNFPGIEKYYKMTHDKKYQHEFVRIFSNCLKIQYIC